MTAASTKTWIISLLEGLDAETLQAFAAQHPLATLGDLARLLGSVRPIEVLVLLLEEALDLGVVDQMARDLLVRCVREQMALGWGNLQYGYGRERSCEFAFAQAAASWSAAFPTPMSHLCQRVLDNVKELAFPGWLPCGPDDPVIRDSFAPEGSTAFTEALKETYK